MGHLRDRSGQSGEGLRCGRPRRGSNASWDLWRRSWRWSQERGWGWTHRGSTRCARRWPHVGVRCLTTPCGSFHQLLRSSCGTRQLVRECGCHSVFFGYAASALGLLTSLGLLLGGLVSPTGGWGACGGRRGLWWPPPLGSPSPRAVASSDPVLPVASTRCLPEVGSPLVTEVIPMLAQPCSGVHVLSPQAVVDADLASLVVGDTPRLGRARRGMATTPWFGSWSRTSVPRSCDSARPIGGPFCRDRRVAWLRPLRLAHHTSGGASGF
jgi:hypothetical protein